MNENSNKNAKKATKKKIRSLKHQSKQEKCIERKIQLIEKRKIIIFLTSIFAVIISLLLYQFKYGSCEFWASYERNYNKIIYGDSNYCQRNINTSLVQEKLLNEIVAQNTSIELIRGALNLANYEEYVQMILHGPTGCGKTLLSQIIANNFPNNNIQKYIWNLYETHNLYGTVKGRLSKCGFNLIILDDLNSNKTTLEFLIDFENMLRDAAIANHYRIVLIAIFKDYIVENDQEDLKNFVLIDFQPFTLESFIECIELHQRLFNIRITRHDLEELKKINYTVSGCKLISKKLNNSL